MQPLAFAENGVCKRREKSTAGAGRVSNRASGDRLFLPKRAEGKSPKLDTRINHAILALQR